MLEKREKMNSASSAKIVYPKVEQPILTPEAQISPEIHLTWNLQRSQMPLFDK